MRKSLVSAAALAAALVFASSARAEKFETLARKAHRLSGPKALTSLFWSLTGNCKRYKNDFRRRQCQGVKEARAAQVTGRTYLIKTTAAIAAGAYDEKKKSVPLSVEACIACQKGGDLPLVLGKGKQRFKGGALHAPQVQETSRTFSNAKKAKAWRKNVLPRLRAEYLVRLPARVDRFKSRAGNGYQVEVVGFRVFDPCRGDVLAARPKSEAVPADRAACGDEVKPEKTAKKPAKPKKPVRPKLPAELSPDQIRGALGKLQPAAQKCFETYGVPGTASFRISISGEGKVVAVTQKGDFTDTPTGECLEKLVKKVTFPKTRKKRTTVTYPIMLR